MDPKYHELRDVAERMGVHIQTVRKWIKQGKLKAYKPTGKKLYVKDEDLRAFIERGEK